MMNVLACCCMVMATCLVEPEQSLQSLVAQLGSPKYQERESAAERLVAIGPESLPAIRLASESTDPEIRTRAAILIEKIESAQLTKPTMITLDYEDQPIRGVVDSLNKRFSTHLSLGPENPTIWDTRRITSASQGEPLPFWKAVDQLCSDASVHINPGGMPTNGRREASLGLSDGVGERSAYVSDQGPFRVSLVGFNYSQNLTYLRGRRMPLQPAFAEIAPVPTDRPDVFEQFNVTLQLIAEPRLMIHQRGAPRVTEAFDEHGQMLTTAGRDQNSPRFAGYAGFHANPVPMLQLQAELARPKSVGKVIRRMKGVIPLAVSTRRPEPLRIALSDPADKVHRNDEVAITVSEVKSRADGPQRTILIQLRPIGTPRAAEAGGQDDVNPGRSDLIQAQRIEIIDATGQALLWLPSDVRTDAEGSRISIVLPANGQPAPVEIRYYGMIRVVTEVAFQFNDVQLDKEDGDRTRKARP